MQEVSVKQTSPVGADLSIVIGKAEVESEVDKYANEIKTKVKVDGFRPGMAPINVIRQRFSKEIRAEVSSRLVHQKTADAIREKGLKAVGNPSLKEGFRATKDRQWLGEFKFDGSFVYEVSTDLEPEVDFINYKGFDVLVDLPNPEKWVASRVLEIQNQFSEREQVDRPAQAGDEITISFVGSKDGVKIEDETGGWRTFKLGSGTFEPRLEADLVGKKVGEAIEKTLTFDDSIGDKAVAGQTVKFDIIVQTVVEVRVPPIDDELARKAVYDDLDHMMVELRAKASEEFDKPRKAKTIDAIVTKILEAHPFMVPPSWIENEMHVIMYRFGAKELPTNPDELASLRELAIRSVQQSFILDKIYQKEPDIRIKGKELEEELEAQAKKVGKTGPELLTFLKNSGRYEGLISFIEHQRAIDFLIANSNIKETL